MAVGTQESKGESVAHVPLDARWYLADLVIQMDIEGDDYPLVHINTVLVNATDPEDAFTKAIELGKSEEMTYENTDHRQVRVRFRGLRELLVIYDELEHGAEMMFEERAGLGESEISALTTKKSDLSVFS